MEEKIRKKISIATIDAGNTTKGFKNSIFNVVHIETENSVPVMEMLPPR
jgi:hypothetical protein